MTITELVFEDALPPDIAPDETPETPGAPDVPPDTDSLACATCGTALTYAGRGRKPKYCDDHKKSGGSNSGSSVKRNTGNERLANQATEALIQLNRITGMGLRLIGLPESANMIAFTEEGFREQAYAALLTDPGLCRQLLAVGGMSGKTALIIAYGMLAAQVGPVAYQETRLAIAERKLAKKEADPL